MPSSTAKPLRFPDSFSRYWGLILPLYHLASESVPKGLGQQACASMSGYILIFNNKPKKSEVTLCDPRIANNIGVTEAMCLLWLF